MIVSPKEPKSRNALRGVAGSRPKQSCFKLIRAAVMANNLTVVKKRLEWLDEADAEKTLLLVLFGIAKTQKYITQKKLFELQGKLNEIGRIIGGLQKFFINNGQQPKK